jgi:hypothetical protein
MRLLVSLSTPFVALALPWLLPAEFRPTIWFGFFPAELAVLDRDGMIVAVNARWTEFVDANAASSDRARRRLGVGTSYLTVCCDPGEATEAGAGIRRVLAGGADRFTME